MHSKVKYATHWVDILKGAYRNILPIHKFFALTRYSVVGLEKLNVHRPHRSPDLFCSRVPHVWLDIQTNPLNLSLVFAEARFHRKEVHRHNLFMPILAD